MTERKVEVANENFQLTISGAKMINTIISLLFIKFYFFLRKNFNIILNKIPFSAEPIQH